LGDIIWPASHFRGGDRRIDMECPFIAPVEKITDYIDHKGTQYYRIIDTAKSTVAEDLTKSLADCIVQAINSHQHFKALIESELEGMRRMVAENENDPQMRPFAQVLKGKVALYRETLSEAEKQ